MLLLPAVAKAMAGEVAPAGIELFLYFAQNQNVTETFIDMVTEKVLAKNNLTA